MQTANVGHDSMTVEPACILQQRKAVHEQSLRKSGPAHCGLLVPGVTMDAAAGKGPPMRIAVRSLR